MNPLISAPTPPTRATLIIPILDDWESADILCSRLNAALKSSKRRSVTLIFIDDGSVMAPFLPSLEQCSTFDAVFVLRLKRNMGHQRAIALGLSYVQENAPCDSLVVMDGDGEDKPEDVPRLLDALESGETPFVFAERGRRLDGIFFRAGYLFYRILHRLLTGRKIRFGNFSALQFGLLRRLTTMPEMWSHYAASVILARIPFRAIRVDRGKRLKGSSKMTIDGLILHGLVAMALYPTINVRVLIASLIGCLVAGLFTAVVALMGLVSLVKIPGWATPAVAVSVVLCCTTTLMSFLFVFLSVGFRTLPGVLPIRDYRYFVECCETLHGTALQRK
jgi:polyisoprenyl-phosphate glycosyltransferase